MKYALLTILMLISINGLAGQVFCNKYGDTTVCNQYREDGSTDSTYYNQYGDTVIGNNYDQDRRDLNNEN